MRPDYEEICKDKIQKLYSEQIEILNSWDLDTFKRKSNSSLFQHIGANVEEAVSEAINAKLQASVESKLGHCYEKIAVEIANAKPKERIQGADGVLIVNVEGKRYKILMSIKLGTTWGNSSSTKGQKSHFSESRAIHAEKETYMICMMGICHGYGKASEKPKRGVDLQLEGDDFWEFITGERNFYIDLVELREKICPPLYARLKFAREECKRRILKQIQDNAHGDRVEFITQTHLENEKKRKQHNNKFISQLIAARKEQQFMEDYFETTTIQLEFDFE